eukprot:4349537-Pyramimonas_sp.AAC.1
MPAESEEVTTLQRAALNTMQMSRHLAGSVWDFYLIPENEATDQGAEMGTAYAEKVKAGEKDLGSRHIHIVVAFLGGL